MRPQERLEMKPERLGTSENSVEYTVGEDDKDFDADCEKADDSTSSESDDEEKTCSKPAHCGPDDQDSSSDSDSSSTDCSSDTSTPKKTPAILPDVDTSMCAICGRGPFRSMKLHLLHCSGVRVKYQCSLCKKTFPTETSLNEHYVLLYSCDICGQVFSHEIPYHQHPCPNKNKSLLVFFCLETMPKVCNICKSFFTSEKTLLNHVTRVHTSVVSRKVCGEKNVWPGVHESTIQLFVNSPNAVSQVINGKLHLDQTNAGPLSTVVSSSASSLTSSSHHGSPPQAPICMAFPAPVKSANNGILSQPTNQLQSKLSAPLFDSYSSTDTTLSTVASEPVSPPMPTIMAMFENGSQHVALMKRMNTGWRFKAPYPCRQCGAVFRQPSLIISHRYLHRGRRSHQCLCGRAFKHRLHLLRHCVQHAEAISYICVSCGETFSGARLLAAHMRGKSRKKSRSGCNRKRKVKTKCKMPFACDCGQLFFRPSAYIWHQLKNWKKNKQMKKQQHKCFISVF